MHGDSWLCIVCESQIPLRLDSLSSRELHCLSLHPSTITERGLAWGSLLDFQCSLHCRIVLVAASATILPLVVPCGKPLSFLTELSLTRTGKSSYRSYVTGYMVRCNQYV